ncbi:MAG: hypothetical protein J4203_07610, partial [Candidatus Diapherotrites archaeon]|nr:hypothetical protein [Candidatus Diapherotrites archaeon]
MKTHSLFDSCLFQAKPQHLAGSGIVKVPSCPIDILPTLKGGDSLCVGEVGECALERIALVADVG